MEKYGADKVQELTLELTRLKNKPNKSDEDLRKIVQIEKELRLMATETENSD